MCVPLLESIPDLKGKVITADAMLTQRKIARQVLDQEADYMFILKDNQKNLNDAVSYYFKELQRIKPQAEPDFRTLTGDETDARRKAPKIQHGRCELREIWVSSELTHDLNAEFDFPGIAQVFHVRRTVKHYRKRKKYKQTVEECVGITSLSADQADAQTLLGYNRGHWSIETVHRILDDANNWNEDHCRIRSGHGPENVSALRRFAIAVIRRYRKLVAPTMRELHGNARLLLDYLRLTKNTRRRGAAVLQ